MPSLDLANVNQIGLLGDTHGSYIAIQDAINAFKKRGINVIVQLGDFGYWTHHYTGIQFLDYVDALLELEDAWLLWIKGNHECVSSKTRAVTREGFKYYWELNPTDEVLSVDDQGFRVWLPIQRLLLKEYAGPLVRVNARGLEMEVTPGHRVVGRKPRSNKWTEHLGSELAGQTFNVVVSGLNNDPDCPLTDDEIKLAAWCLTDSHKNSNGWSFYQREEKVQPLLDLLDRLLIPYSVSGRVQKPCWIGDKFVSSDKMQMTIKVPASDSRNIIFEHKEIIPQLFQMSERQMEIFLEEYVYCDGSMPTRSTTSRVIYCNDKVIREQLQLLLITNGYRCSTTEYRPGDWRLNISKRNLNWFCSTSFNDKKPQTDVSMIDYDGEVWCLKVPNGRFFAELNGKIFLTGNCHENLLNQEYGGEQFPNRLIEIRSRIWHIPNGLFFSIGDTSFLGCGGSVSVDQSMRRQGVDWWPEEVMTVSDYYECTRPEVTESKVDVLLSHDAPHQVPLNTLLGKFKSMKLNADLHLTTRGQRDILAAIVKEVTPEFVFHGHYHNYHNTPVRVGNNLVQVVGLAHEASSDNKGIFNTQTKVFTKI